MFADFFPVLLFLFFTYLLATLGCMFFLRWDDNEAHYDFMQPVNAATWILTGCLLIVFAIDFALSFF